MASSDRQPEGPSIEEFEEKQAELVGKLTEISTSMRQCADIFDSFTRFVGQLSFRSTASEVLAHRQPSGLLSSRGSGSADRSDPPSTTAQVESIGSPSNAQGTEGYRRSIHSYPSGPMLPPAVPTFHAAGLSGVHPSLASMHSSTGHSPYPSQRPSSAASGTGSGGVRETGIPSRRGVGVVPTPSEHHTSSGKHAKRKRHQPTDTEDYGDESEVDTGLEGSPQPEAHEAPSESHQPPRRPLKRSADTMEESLSARVFLPRGRVGVGAARNEDRLPEPATGPSIVVFSSGPGSSKSRALHSRGPVPVSTRNRKEKKPKDPNAPKQPPPAYIVYQNEIRESMRARFPTHSPTELVKEIAATWKTLSNSERQRYKDYANIEKDRWVAELAAYQASISNSEEGQKGSEGTFLATTGVSDSPPGSSPRQSPEPSDAESDPQKARRVTSQQDIPSTSGSYEYRGSVRTSSSFSGPSAAGLSASGESRPGRRTTQEYGGQPQEVPIRMERSLSRHGYTPSHSPRLYGSMSIPPPGGRAYPGHAEPRPSSTRLPSIGSLGFGHSLQPGPRESTPGPIRELSETEGEPASKRQRTKTNTPPEEKEDADSGRPAREGQKTG
ncbi:high mobility group, partial [Rhizoctonia solani]